MSSLRKHRGPGTPACLGYAHERWTPRGTPAELRCPSVPSWETRPAQSRWLTTLERRTDSTRRVSNHMDRSVHTFEPVQTRSTTPPPANFPQASPACADKALSGYYLRQSSETRAVHLSPSPMFALQAEATSKYQGFRRINSVLAACLSGSWESSILAAGRDL
jgi:hypothetical protein